jgi:hydrogenase maturation protein HypF
MDISKTHDGFSIEIKGIVQGVGFRPFIYKLATGLGIKGSVANTTEGVLINIEKISPVEFNEFIDLIKRQKPAPAVIESITFKKTLNSGYDKFTIEKSREAENRFQLISPDIATCEKCQEDIFNKDDSRRYLYPFTNCTNCGPRFTIIKKMPYDRPNTTMDKFDMCPDCLKEYCNPSDRRFHAQPNACNNCGPRLLLIDATGKILNKNNPIKEAADLIMEGKIAGIKSLGGFQIACDAFSDDTVKELRKRKSRPSKPFAIMAGNIEWIRENYHLSPAEAASLLSSRAPIVLIKKKNGVSPIAYNVSQYNKYEGIMLPYTPVHHILFKYVDGPLIMTSGNISEEPIASDNDDAIKRLGKICDYYLIHNRDIYSRYDDSVVRIFTGREMVIRRARGYAPYPVKLDGSTGRKTIFAAGAQQKNTFTILTGNYAVTSQHLGDLDSFLSSEFFNSTLKNYKSLFSLEDFDIIAHDLHPAYTSTKLAHEISDSKDALFPVQHHEAHIASVIAENNPGCRLIGFSWDGTGYGYDSKIWGSEIFEVSRNLDFKRIGHLCEKPLPGGDAAIKRPYRMAAVYLNQIWERNDSSQDLIDYIYKRIPFRHLKKEEIMAVCEQIKAGFNTPITTSMGRFFDAVSSMLNFNHINTFEGEAAISLEMAIDDKYIDETFKKGLKNIERPYRYETCIKKIGEKYIIDDFDIFNSIIADLERGLDKGFISFKFHNTLASIVLEVSMDYGKLTKINSIALSGGVFQNNYLLELCFMLLKNNDFDVYSNFNVPVNDGGISLGQAYIAAFKKNLLHKGAQ